MLWGAITTALLFGAYRFIGNVLDYAGDTREDFMREYAEADAAFLATLDKSRGGCRPSRSSAAVTRAFAQSHIAHDKESF